MLFFMRFVVLTWSAVESYEVNLFQDDDRGLVIQPDCFYAINKTI